MIFATNTNIFKLVSFYFTMKDNLISFLKESLEFELDFDKILEKPKVASYGDWSMPCFLLSKELGKNPAEIAKELADKLSRNRPEFLEIITAVGPFINFHFNKIQEAKDVLRDVFEKSIFDVKVEIPQKVLLEYPSPNTNKSLHIGHVRNMLIGNSLTKILKKTGNEVIKTNMNNDRGIAICKSMLGYELFFKDKTPESLGLKPDDFVAKCYVEFGNQAKKNPDMKLDEKAQNMLVKWEAGDKEIRDLWKKVMKWVFDGYKETYESFKINGYDIEFFFFFFYDKGKDIVLNALENNVKGFVKGDDGAVFCDLEDVGYDKKYLLRGDGTTLYMTQDLYLAQVKEEKFNPDMSVFIVGREQEYHFQVLFEILERLGFGGNDKNYHFSYGYVYNKDGKKFSSRKGEVVGADWLVNEAKKKAYDNLLTKEISKNLDEEELKRRSDIISYAALAFSILRVNPKDDTNFDLDRALAFEGETGPYVQYTYARIQSILKKSDISVDLDVDYNVFGEKEITLIKLLKEYKNIIDEASSKYKISAIANYLIKICKAFNDFYQNCSILKADTKEQKKARLLLAKSTADMIKDCLELLDIEVLEEM